MAHEPASAARDGPAEPLEAFGGLDGRSPPTVVVPDRFQMSRLKGWRKAPNTVYVGRPGKFGNPLSVEEHGRATAIALYQAWILEAARAPLWAEALATLRGENLGCWCRPGLPCHADGLPRLVNEA